MELREPPPGGREVQVLLASRSPAGLSLGPFPEAALSRREVRVGGWPVSLPVDSHSGLVLQPGQHCPSPSEAALGLRAQRAGVLLAGACSLSLSLSSFSLCVQVTLHGILFFGDFVIFSNMSWDLRSCHGDAKDTVSGLSCLY